MNPDAIQSGANELDQASTCVTGLAHARGVPYESNVDARTTSLSENSYSVVSHTLWPTRRARSVVVPSTSKVRLGLSAPFVGAPCLSSLLTGAAEPSRSSPV